MTVIISLILGIIIGLILSALWLIFLIGLSVQNEVQEIWKFIEQFGKEERQRIKNRDK